MAELTAISGLGPWTVQGALILALMLADRRHGNRSSGANTRRTGSMTSPAIHGYEYRSGSQKC
jgi:hypothetical protein